MTQLIAQIPCDNEIDYSEIIGDRVLPFLIELDEAESDLDPAPGDNQRFCYNVSGVGFDQPLYADLSHLVLGICDEITEGQIVNISVMIDGIMQEIDFGEGGNVELRTPDQPDPPTGCPGLKFNFGLDKVDGEMSFCFELTTPYPVGPNVVCLSGSGVTANQLSICGPACGILQACETVGYQPSAVCVPVTVTPFAITGETTTFCCGEPTVSPSTTQCGGIENGSCFFTITQNICVSIPVEFGATATVGDPSVQCGEATSENVCINCGANNGEGVLSVNSTTSKKVISSTTDHAKTVNYAKAPVKQTIKIGSCPHCKSAH